MLNPQRTCSQLRGRGSEPQLRVMAWGKARSIQRPPQHLDTIESELNSMNWTRGNLAHGPDTTFAPMQGKRTGICHHWDLRGYFKTLFTIQLGTLPGREKEWSISTDERAETEIFLRRAISTFRQRTSGINRSKASQSRRKVRSGRSSLAERIVSGGSS